jgi:2-polyprenyl-6-methoxyphenol hydroxylase-like FAD-dependent oxidoreductase
MRNRSRRALVIGGSVGGLFAALYLRRRGWDVEVYERSPVPLTGRGAGIMTHPELRHALVELGLDTTRDFGVPIAGRLMLDGTGARSRAGPARRSPPRGTAYSRC